MDTVLDKILADVERLMVQPVYVEENGDKGFLAKEIRRREFWPHKYSEKENKYVKIATYLRKWWDNIVWLEGTDPAYLAQIMDYTEEAEHDDAPDSCAVLCRLLDKRG